MKSNDPLRRALQQAADGETPPPAPHEFSESHERQMAALFAQKPVSRSRWLTVLLPLAACLAVAVLVGWELDWGRQTVDPETPKASQTGTSASLSTTTAAGNVRRPTGSNNNALTGASPNDICHFLAIVRVESVCDGWLTYTVLEDSAGQIAGCRLIVENSDDYTVGEVLTVDYSARSFLEENGVRWLTPETIFKTEG